MKPLFLSHWKEGNKVYVQPKLVKSLRNHHLSGVRFLYNCCRKKHKGAILNYDPGMNFPLIIQAFLSVAHKLETVNFPVLVLVLENHICMWHYHLKQIGVEATLLSERNAENVFKKEEYSIILSSFNDLKILHPFRENEFSMVIVDHFDTVASKMIFKKLGGNFNIGLTNKDFMADRDQKLLWTMLNWSNPKLFGKLSEFYARDTEHLNNLRDPYDEVWHRLTWNFCESFVKDSEEEQEAYRETLRDWSARMNLKFASAPPKKTRKRKLANLEECDKNGENVDFELEGVNETKNTVASSIDKNNIGGTTTNIVTDEETIVHETQVLLENCQVDEVENLKSSNEPASSRNKNPFDIGHQKTKSEKRTADVTSKRTTSKNERNTDIFESVATSAHKIPDTVSEIDGLELETKFKCGTKKTPSHNMFEREPPEIGSILRIKGGSRSTWGKGRASRQILSSRTQPKYNRLDVLKQSVKSNDKNLKTASKNIIVAAEPLDFSQVEASDIEANATGKKRLPVRTTSEEKNGLRNTNNSEQRSICGSDSHNPHSQINRIEKATQVDENLIISVCATLSELKDDNNKHICNPTLGTQDADEGNETVEAVEVDENPILTAIITGSPLKDITTKCVGNLSSGTSDDDEDYGILFSIMEGKFSTQIDTPAFSCRADMTELCTKKARRNILEECNICESVSHEGNKKVKKIQKTTPSTTTSSSHCKDDKTEEKKKIVKYNSKNILMSLYGDQAEYMSPSKDFDLGRRNSNDWSSMHSPDNSLSLRHGTLTRDGVTDLEYNDGFCKNVSSQVKSNNLWGKNDFLKSLFDSEEDASDFSSCGKEKRNNLSNSQRGALISSLFEA